MNDILKSDLYNYSFDISKSPYGPKYLESIKHKLSPQSRRGIFILTIDCWSVSTRDCAPNDAENFIENNSAVGAIKSVHTNPNFDYLLNHFSGSYYKILSKSPEAFLHDDGWLEVTLNDDAQAVKRRTQSTLLNYEQYLKVYQFSSLRFDYLLKTIEFLKQHGKVYLVRMPVSEQLMKIEEKYAPHFSERIKMIEPQTNGFLDLTPFNQYYSYTDGVHLQNASAYMVSEKIAFWIKENLSKHVSSNTSQ